MLDEGTEVEVDYTGKLQDGTVFDSTDPDSPLCFTIGEDEIVEGFEKAVRELSPGESVTTEIPPEKGYGDWQEDMIMPIEREMIPDEVNPQVGMQIQLRLEEGQTVPVLIDEVREEKVIIDANHPLAGRTLVFDITLISANSG